MNVCKSSRRYRHFRARKLPVIWPDFVYVMMVACETPRNFAASAVQRRFCIGVPSSAGWPGVGCVALCWERKKGPRLGGLERGVGVLD
jgi:hypothetical protein